MKTLAAKLFKHIFESKSWRLQKSHSFPNDIQVEITNLLKLAKKHKETKRFHLIEINLYPTKRLPECNG